MACHYPLATGHTEPIVGATYETCYGSRVVLRSFNAATGMGRTAWGWIRLSELSTWRMVDDPRRWEQRRTRGDSR